MRRRLWSGLTAVGLLGLTFGLSGCGTKSTPVATTVPSNAQKVDVTAHNFSWTLSRTKFQTGKPIDFIVDSQNGVHGFSLVQTDISHTIKPGDKPVNLVWTPPGPGRYTIRCNVFCGSGHDNMFTSFTVS